MSNPKILLIGLGIVLVSCVVLGLVFNGAADNTSHALDSMALVKAMETMNKSMDVMNNQISIINKMTNIITFQNVAFMVGGLLVLFIAIAIFRSNSSGKNNNQPIIIQAGASEPSYPALPSGMPHYVSFGKRGVDYFRRLPPAIQEQVLNELYNTTAEFERIMGRSHAMVMYDKGGKVKGQRFS